MTSNILIWETDSAVVAESPFAIPPLGLQEAIVVFLPEASVMTKLYLVVAGQEAASLEYVQSQSKCVPHFLLVIRNAALII